MAYKPEMIARTRLTRKAEARARRTAKKAAARLMRRAARQDPEAAPVRLATRGWLD